MHIAITQSELVSMLMKDEYANWTYKGASALAEYIEEMDYQMGKEHPRYSIDIVAVRCEYSQYLDNKEETALEQVLDDYSTVDGLDSVQSLMEHTTVIVFDGGLIITEF